MCRSIVAFALFSFLIAFFHPTRVFGQGTDEENKTTSNDRFDISSNLTWQVPFEEKGRTIIPGFLKTSSGSLEFRWVVDAGGSARLITLESSGSAETPLLEKQIWPLPLDTGITLLFQEWFPLSNTMEPSTLRLLANVSTHELFDKVPASHYPPASQLQERASPIVWGVTSRENGIQYLEGSLRATFGALTIFWKKKSGGIPELITRESPGAGELPVVEAKLLPWIVEADTKSFLCQPRYPQLNQRFCPYLWCLATVQTHELMSGYDRLARCSR